MSYTTIYLLGAEPCELASFRNSWRGPMYVWNAVAEKYWGLKNFPYYDKELQSRVWNTNRTHAMPPHEVIVLLSTMDGALVRTEDAAALLDAFRQYGAEHPNSSYAEQAVAIAQSVLKPSGWLAWQATSVGEFWGGGWDGERDEPCWYDPNNGDRHFDVFAAAREGFAG